MLRTKFSELVKVIAEQTQVRDPHSYHGLLNLFRPCDLYSEESEEAQLHNVDNLAEQISPEDVCIDESSPAAEYRLREFCIFDSLTLHDAAPWLFRALNLRTFKE